MPASTYPDLVVSYPPAKRGAPVVKGGRSGVAPPAAAAPGATPAVCWRSVSAPGLALPAVRAKSTGDPARSLRLHPIQCGFSATKKTCYSALEVPISMAQDPKWSSDLHRQSHKLKRDFTMDMFTTAGFMPSPVAVDYATGARRLVVTRASLS
mmetsp:Transcript_111984/g.321790  ORF Transcript_111984/g.321790 Transcript_111984/m.321790 type:complete len:153 (-) Transcript_111984:87-545(-)